MPVPPRHSSLKHLSSTSTLRMAVLEHTHCHKLTTPSVHSGNHSIQMVLKVWPLWLDFVHCRHWTLLDMRAMGNFTHAGQAVWQIATMVMSIYREHSVDMVMSIAHAREWCSHLHMRRILESSPRTSTRIWILFQLSRLSDSVRIWSSTLLPFVDWCSHTFCWSKLCKEGVSYCALHCSPMYVALAQMDIVLVNCRHCEKR